MLKREMLWRRVVFVLCAGLVCAAAALPGGVRAAAMADNAFVRLCEKGSPEEVRRALADGADPGARLVEEGVPDHTALMRAARNPRVEVVRMLLAAGADVNGADGDGGTALMEAASSNENPEALRALLAAGAKVDAKGFFGVTALMRATANRNPEVMRALLAADADVHARDDDGGTALMQAAENGNPEFLEALLAAGADAQARDKEGRSVLMAAAASGNAGAVRRLLAAGADPKIEDTKGRDALWHARHADHRFVGEEEAAEVVRALEDGGKDDGAIRFLREVQDKLVEDDKDAWMLAHTSKAIQQAALDDYDYDCSKKACYGWWILRTSSQDGEELLGVESAGEGWYVVRLRYYGGDVAVRMRVVRDGGGYRITGLVNPDRKLDIR